jgi:hypothetical protein
MSVGAMFLIGIAGVLCIISMLGWVIGRSNRKHGIKW